MEFTERLALPLLVPGQAQKEVLHNEALQVLDTVAVAAVEEAPRNDPPQAPQPGTAYIIGPQPTAEWSGFAGHLAAYSSAGWRFIAPIVGLRALVKTTSTFAEYGSAGWEIGTVRASRVVVGSDQVVGAQASAIPDPSGGTIVDAEARATISTILSALRQHGLISQ